MALIEINWNPSRAELRQFAGLWLAFSGAIGAVAWWQTHSWPLAGTLWAVGSGTGLAGLLSPPLVRPIFVASTVVAYPIGWTVSHLLLGLIFHGLLTPIGLLMRLCGRDPLRRSFDRAAATYWIPHEPSEDISRYFRQL